jgi:hypothetical protein
MTYFRLSKPKQFLKVFDPHMGTVTGCIAENPKTAGDKIVGPLLFKAGQPADQPNSS